MLDRTIVKSCTIWSVQWVFLILLALVELTQSDPIEVTALGRVASLGEFYDVRNDQFLRLNLLKNNIPKSSISLTETRKTNSKYVIESTMEQKFDALDISAELRLSILGGLISLEGSGQYLKDKKTNSKSIRASLIQKFSTVNEQVSILHEDLQNVINFNVLSQIDATHVVIGIQWGGNVIITLEDENNDNHDITHVKGNLQWAATQISGSGKVDINQGQERKLSKFRFEIFGDLLPKDAALTVSDALEFMKMSPQLLLEANNGKGKAVKYTLLPLKDLKKLWNVTIEVSNTIREIDFETIRNCVRLFDRLRRILQELQGTGEEVDKFKNHLQPEIFNKMYDMLNTIEMYYHEFTSNLSRHSVRVRSGTEDISALREFSLEFTKKVNNWQQVNQKFLTSIRGEIAFLYALRKLKVTLYDKGQTYSQFLYENRDRYLTIFLYNYEENIYKDNTFIYLREDIETNHEASDVFVAVSYGVITNEQSIENLNRTNTIRVYVDQELIADIYSARNVGSDIVLEMHKRNMYGPFFPKIMVFNRGEQDGILHKSHHSPLLFI